MDAPVTLTAGGHAYTLRRARRADLPALTALLADDSLGAGRETPADSEPYAAAFAAIDADPAHLLAVVTAAEDTPIGMMQVTVIPGLSRQGARRAQIEGVRVAAAHRGGGLGGAMIAWAIDEARRQGCALVQLTSDKQRAEAHRFYTRLGFTASHEGFKLNC